MQVERNVMAGLLEFIAICLMAANLVESRTHTLQHFIVSSTAL